MNCEVVLHINRKVEKQCGEWTDLSLSFPICFEHAVHLARTEQLDRAERDAFLGWLLADPKRVKAPRQKPGRSKQDYGTPWELIRAIEKRFGAFAWDLAATKENAKAPRFITPEIDSLKVDWPPGTDGNLWLNCEFAFIAPWAKKCAEHVAKLTFGSLLILLTPASVGSNWFASYVQKNALVLPLSPRFPFEGQAPNPKTGIVDPYPKDCMISVFGEKPGFEPWRWK